MQVPPAEIIDRMSIVKLKIDRIGKPELQKEFDALKQALEEFKQTGLIIKNEWFEELYEINKEEWDILEKMNEERKKENNYDRIGRLYIKTEELNKKRALAKNKIVKETGKGFIEIKKNHYSE